MKVYKITVDDSDSLGMNCISLVDDPAVMEDFLTFHKYVGSESLLKLSKVDDEQRVVTGVVAIADVPIYRFNKQLGNHYIIFDKETIKKMVYRYFKNGYTNNVNIEHQGPYVPGITLFESYIKDSSRGICPKEFSDIPDGSWLVSYKVDNDDLWSEIKAGNTLKGFSLEGWFQYGEEVKMSKENKEDYDEWLDEILK